MAEQVSKFEFSVLERQYLARALDLYKASLVRSRSKEMAGSDIWTLRGKEIEAVGALLSRF